MIEGLWIAQYAGIQGFDNGVVVLTQGKVLGGDNGYTYTGTYCASEAGVKATIRIRNYNSRIASILSLKGDYTIEVNLQWESDQVLKGQGTVMDEDIIGLALKLTKYESLP